MPLLVLTLCGGTGISDASRPFQATQSVKELRSHAERRNEGDSVTMLQSRLFCENIPRRLADLPNRSSLAQCSHRRRSQAIPTHFGAKGVSHFHTETHATPVTPARKPARRPRAPPTSPALTRFAGVPLASQRL